MQAIKRMRILIVDWAWREVRKVEHDQLSLSALAPASSDGVQE
jgi:hypothetical protein